MQQQSKTRSQIKLPILQRACVLLSPPLSVSERTEGADEETLSTVIALIKSMRTHDEALSLSKALGWRVGIASSAGEDRLGAWLLLDGIFEAIASKQVVLGEWGAVFVDNLIASLPDLVRCRWDRYTLNTASTMNRFLIRHYGRIEAKWLSTTKPLFLSKIRQKLEVAFKEISAPNAKLKSLEKYHYLHSCGDECLDAIWKLRRTDARPNISRQLYQLFGGKSKYPPHSGIAVFKVREGNGESRNVEEPEDLSHLLQPLHPKLVQWLEKLKEHHGGCCACDTFSHKESDCPCRKTRASMSTDQAIITLTQAGCKHPTHPDTMEVFDLISKEMANHRPYDHLLTAFDLIRRSTTTSREQSALCVISSYCLKPSLLREKYKPAPIGSHMNDDLIANNETYRPGEMVLMTLPSAVCKHFTDRCRIIELKNLKSCVAVLRNSFFSAENSEHPKEDLEKWIKSIRAERLPLFAYFDKNGEDSARSASATAPPDLPKDNDWDRRLRRVGVHCAKLCRNCLSLKHVAVECDMKCTYDQLAARDALEHFRFTQPLPLTMEIVEKIQKKMQHLRLRRPLESHRLEMALKILVPHTWLTGNGPRNSDRVACEYCEDCHAYGHTKGTCPETENLVKFRVRWPRNHVSLQMFPDEVRQVLGTKPADDRDMRLVTYSMAGRIPKNYKEALIVLCGDNDVFPQERDMSETFNPGMVRYKPTLVMDLLRLSDRPRLINLVASVLLPGGPEPCVFCGTIAHISLKCNNCPHECSHFLRGLYRHCMNLTEFLDQKSELAKSYLRTLDEKRTTVREGFDQIGGGGGASQRAEQEDFDLAIKGLDGIYRALDVLEARCHEVAQNYLRKHPINSSSAVGLAGGAGGMLNGAGSVVPLSQRRVRMKGSSLVKIPSLQHHAAATADAEAALIGQSMEFGAGSSIGGAAAGFNQTNEFDDWDKAADLRDVLQELDDPAATATGNITDALNDVLREAELEAELPEYREDDEPARKKQRID